MTKPAAVLRFRAFNAAVLAMRAEFREVGRV